MERRYLNIEESRVELRADGEGEPRQIRGHAAVTNVVEEIFPGFREVIRPGAFEEAIGRDDVRALWNHDSNIVLGRTTSGTLELREDEIGLAYSVRPPDTPLVRDMVIAPIERQDVTGSSFGFHVDRATETPEENGGILRTIESLTLVDVSPVTFPAYPDATVALRGALERKSEGDSRDILRRVIGRDLTDQEFRCFLAGEPIVKIPESKGPAVTDSPDFMIPLQRRRLDLDRLEIEG